MKTENRSLKSLAIVFSSLFAFACMIPLTANSDVNTNTGGSRTTHTTVTKNGVTTTKTAHTSSRHIYHRGPHGHRTVRTHKSTHRTTVAPATPIDQSKS